jgi:hypothetical protein
MPCTRSLGDLLSDFVTLVSLRYSTKPPDRDHPFGHGAQAGRAPTWHRHPSAAPAPLPARH